MSLVVWAAERKVDGCHHERWYTDSVWLKFGDADEYVGRMKNEYPELLWRLRSWTLR